MTQRREGDAQTSTPFYEGGPFALARPVADGWNVNLHFLADDDHRCYVFNVEETEFLVKSLQRELTAARLALASTGTQEPLR